MRAVLVAAMLLLAAPVLAQGTGQRPLESGQMQRGYSIDETGRISWYWRLDRPGQAPLLGNDPPPMTAQERQRIQNEADGIRRAYAARNGQGQGGQGSGQGSRHNVRGGSPTQPTWNQNPDDRRAYGAQDARTDAARSDAARRAEFARRGIPWPGN